MIEEVVLPELPEAAEPVVEVPTPELPVEPVPEIPVEPDRNEVNVLEDILTALTTPEESAMPEESPIVEESPLPEEGEIVLEVPIVGEGIPLDDVGLILGLVGDLIEAQPWTVVEQERPFMTTPFVEYSVTEGLILLLLLFFFLSSLAKVVKEAF